MATYQDLLDAIARVREATGDPEAWKSGLSGEDIAAVSSVVSKPAALGAVLAKIIATHPEVFLTGPPGAGPPEPPPRIREGLAAEAIRDAETALAQQNSVAAKVDLQVIAAVLNAHATHADGVAELDRLQQEVENAVLTRTDLGTPAGAREFQHYLMEKLRDIRIVVDTAGLDASSKATLAAALASLYAAADPEPAPPAGADDQRTHAAEPDPATPARRSAPSSEPIATGARGSGAVAAGELSEDPLPQLDFGGDLGGLTPSDLFGLPQSDPPALPSPAAPAAVPAPAPPAAGWGGGLPGGMPFGGALPSSPVSALPNLSPLPDRGSDPVVEGPLREPEPDPSTARETPADEPDPEPADEPADEPTADTGADPASTVALPGGEIVTAPTPALAGAITSALAGTPIPDAFRQQGITIPAPGSAVTAPVDVGRLVPGDVGVFTDRHALALGNGKALLDSRIQPITSVTGPGFLGWEHPPAPETTSTTSETAAPEVPAPERPAPTAPS